MSHQMHMSYELLAKALFDSYECIYDVDMETHHYCCYHESAPYHELKVEREGDDFFLALERFVPRAIHYEDREYVLRALSRKELLAGVQREKYYTLLYRIWRNKQLVYHKLRATIQMVGTDTHVLLGIRNVDQMIRRELERKELKEALRMSRIHNSASQMQPHFLYNALASIQEVMLQDAEYASRLLGDFTLHLRSCVRAMQSDALVPFSQELQNIRAYVNIEKMRFGERLSMQYDIATEHFLVLPLCIQPLVENAIRHGIYERGEAGGEVLLRTREAEDAFHVEVKDTGVGFNTSRLFKNSLNADTDSIGLKNLMFRLDKVLHAKVKIDSTPGKGTRILVIIPKKDALL